MRFQTERDAIDYLFRTRRQVPVGRGLDEHTRDPGPTRRLLLATGLLDPTREYAVITGSKGKGSTAALTAQLLTSLGHKTGLVTGPHLVHWTERIRLDGRAMPQADFLRIVNDLAPAIDREIDRLTSTQYISPQGLFLLIALQWFKEQNADAAILEVGRGGRYDDMALVPNHVALFTPIFLEHTQYLGPTVERIAWHKAGIIKQGSYVYSLPQEKSVLEIIQREADAQHAEFFWFSQRDLAQHVADTPDGMRIRLQRYGEIALPFYGRYMVANATLAVQAAGNIHGRLPGMSHGSADYVARIQAGLQTARWPGRLQKLQDAPAVYVDGAVNILSARDLVASLRHRLTPPVIVVAGAPRDRDYPAVYAELATLGDTLILTDTDIHPNIHFPDSETASDAARPHYANVIYGGKLPTALDEARRLAGSSGSVVLAVAQPLVGEAMMIYGVNTRDLTGT